MSELLEKVFIKTSKLPPHEQNALAKWILEELASEQRWIDTFENTSDLLAPLADEALAEYRAGKTQELDSDEL